MLLSNCLLFFVVLYNRLFRLVPGYSRCLLIICRNRAVICRKLRFRVSRRLVNRRNNRSRYALLLSGSALGKLTILCHISSLVAVDILDCKQAKRLNCAESIRIVCSDGELTFRTRLRGINKESLILLIKISTHTCVFKLCNKLINREVRGYFYFTVIDGNLTSGLYSKSTKRRTSGYFRTI